MTQYSIRAFQWNIEGTKGFKVQDLPRMSVVHLFQSKLWFSFVALFWHVLLVTFTELD
jgi:hypothetical protein